MDSETFKKACDIQDKIKFLTTVLRKFTVDTTTKHIKVGDIEFARFNTGEIRTEIDGTQQGQYFASYAEFNSRVTKEFVEITKENIKKLEEQFKNL